MQYCAFCKVTVAGNKHCCPLCGGVLSGTPEPETEVFPALPSPRFSTHLTLRLLALLSIAASATCVLTNIALGAQVWWSLFVVVGAACAWGTAAVAIAHRRNLTVSITWQALLVSGLSVLWDLGIGWRGWSVNFVLPCVFAAAQCIILLLTLLLKLPPRSFSVPTLTCGLFGLVPLVLVLCGKVDMPILSLICSGVSIMMLSALLLFCWAYVKAELHRMLHL